MDTLVKILNSVNNRTAMLMGSPETIEISDVQFSNAPSHYDMIDDKWILTLYDGALTNEFYMQLEMSKELPHIYHYTLSNGAYAIPPSIKKIGYTERYKNEREEFEKLDTNTKWQILKNDLLEETRQECFVEGIPSVIEERNLARFFRKNKKMIVRDQLVKIKDPEKYARDYVEEKILTQHSLLSANFEAEAYLSMGVDPEVAIPSAIKAAVANHHAYFIGFVGLRDLPSKQFRQLLRNQDGHRDKRLMWNRKKTDTEVKILTDGIKIIDSSLKSRSRDIAFDPYALEQYMQYVKDAIIELIK